MIQSHSLTLFLACLVFVLLLVAYANQALRERVPAFAARKKPLMTAAEMKFYTALLSVVKGRWTIFCKVRLIDLIVCVPDSLSNRNMVMSKHLDFVLLHPTTLETIAVIELDDSSHRSERAKKSDQVKNTALSTAGIHLIRMKCAANYDLAVLRNQLENITANTANR